MCLRVKRFFDVTVSFVGIVMTLPLFAIITASIMLLMPGSIFFRQIRVGKNGKLFKLNKFRTMLEMKEAQLGAFHAGDGSRITPLGRVLRKTKLDELPQLYNVFIGDMSLVGPRPEVKEWTTFYEDKWQIVHTMRPGITDNASILFRNEELLLSNANDPNEEYKRVILPKKLELYIEYVKNNSLLGDVKIIIKTIIAVMYK